VPRFFATLLLVESPAAYDLTLPEPYPSSAETTTVRVARAVELAKLDAALGLPGGTLAELNPELRHKATPNREYQLQVPRGNEDTVVASLGAMPVYAPPTPEYGTHVVRSGETLGRIASRYGTSVGSIMHANNIRSANKIWPGQRLKVPGRGGVRVASAVPAPAPSAGTHTVRSGDSLYSIASKYHTTVAQLKADNGLASTSIVPGQKLKVRPGSRSDLKRYTVRKGDTLGAIATRHGVRLASLLHTNGLSARSVIHPGQLLVIPD
jgi:membrane-bound lytic murein transglycosylase D